MANANSPELVELLRYSSDSYTIREAAESMRSSGVSASEASLQLIDLISSGRILEVEHSQLRLSDSELSGW